jgi:hypothetical protein
MGNPQKQNTEAGIQNTRDRRQKTESKPKIFLLRGLECGDVHIFAE